MNITLNGERRSVAGRTVAQRAAGRLIAPQRYGDTPAWVARAAEAARAAIAD